VLPLQAVKGFGELAKALQFAGLITLLRHGGNQTVPHNLMNNSSADITSFRVASQRVSTEKDAVGSAVRLLVLIMGGGLRFARACVHFMQSGGLHLAAPTGLRLPTRLLVYFWLIRVCAQRSIK
jgi:hypothetical protein